MADVTLLDEYGTPRVIDESEASEALAAGWRAESAEEYQARTDAERYGGTEQTLLGGAEALMRGATLGGSDYLSRLALDAIQGEGAGARDAAAAAARRRQLGAAGTGLELAGAVAPALLSGGTGAAGALARMTPAGAVARGGVMAEQLAARGLAGAGIPAAGIAGRAATAGTRLAAGGAVEGAAFGAGQALSEATLQAGEIEGLGEKMLAGAGKGFLSGAALGGVLGTVGGGVAGAAGRVAPKLQSPLTRFAEERAFKALTPRQGDMNKLIARGGDDRVREIGREMLESGVLKAGAKSDEHLVAAVQKHAQKATDDLVSFRERIYSAIDDAAEKASRGSGYRSRARLADVTDEASTFLRRVEAEIVAPLDNGLAPASIVSRVRKVQRELAPLSARIEAGGTVTMREMVDFRKRIDTVLRPKSTAGGLPPVPPAHMEQLEHARGLLEETIEEVTERVATKLDPKLAGKYAELKRGYGLAADMRKLAEKGALRELRNRWVQPSDYGTGIALAAGIVGSGGAIIPALAKGAALSMAHKLMRERGSSLLAVAAYRASRGDKVLSDSVRKFLAAGERRGVAIGATEPKALPPKRPPVMTPAQYAQRLRELEQATPDKINGLDQGAAESPQVAAATVATLTRATSYLRQEAPSGLLSDDPLQPHLVKPSPNRADLERYARKWAMVDDPVGTIERKLADGTLTREHVEALKAVYPVTYAEVRQKVYEEIADSKERVPYAQRIRLGLLFDVPADKSLRPDQIARTQQLYAVTLPNEQAAQGPPQAAQAPLQLAQSHATPAQAIEGGMNQF